MPAALKDLDFFKTAKPDNPDLPMRIYQMMTEVIQFVNNMEQQTNSNVTGEPTPPPPINALDVQGGNGSLSVAINHEGVDFYRGVRYFVEHSTNPNFTNPQVVDLGTSRNRTMFLGNREVYVRGYASYPGSPPGPPVYFGTPAQPRVVLTGGNVGPAPILRSQGSGTGTPGEGLSGFGRVPYRTKNGKPPTR